MKGNATLDESKQRVVLATADVAARPDAGAALTDEDVPGQRMFATEFFDAKTTTGRVTTVTR